MPFHVAQHAPPTHRRHFQTPHGPEASKEHLVIDVEEERTTPTVVWRILLGAGGHLEPRLGQALQAGVKHAGDALFLEGPGHYNRHPFHRREAKPDGLDPALDEIPPQTAVADLVREATRNLRLPQLPNAIFNVFGLGNPVDLL